MANNNELEIYLNAINKLENAKNKRNTIVSPTAEIDNQGVVSNPQQYTASQPKKKKKGADSNFFESLFGTITQTIDTVVGGFVDVAEGIVDAGVGLMGEVGDWFGADSKWAENFIKYDISNTLMEFAPTNMISKGYKSATGTSLNEHSIAYDFNESTQDIILGVEQGIGQTLAMIGTGGNMAVFGIGAGGQSVEQALNEGAELDKALLYGATSGLVEVGVEMVSGGIGKLLGIDLTAIPGMKGLKNKGIKEIIGSFISEGGEEVLSDLINPALKSIYNGKTVQENWNEDINPSGLFQTFVIGGLSGSLMTGAGEVYRTAYYSSEGKKIQNEMREINERVIKAKENYDKAKQTTLDDHIKAYNDFVAVQEQAKLDYQNLVPRVEALAQKYQERLKQTQEYQMDIVNEMDIVQTSHNEVLDRLNKNRTNTDKYTIEYVDDKNKYNGKIIDNKIYLSTNPTKAYRQILSHEISHTMENNSEYNEFIDKMYTELKDNSEFKESLEWARENYNKDNEETQKPKEDDQTIKSEAVAEYIANNFFSSYKDIKDAFESKSMLDKFKDMIKNLRKTSKSEKLRNEYLKLFKKLNNTKVSENKKTANVAVANYSKKGYNKDTKKGERSNEFRRIQEESRREFTKMREQRIYAKNNEGLQRRLSDIFTRELDSRGYNSSSNRLLHLDNFNIYENVDGTLFHDIFEVARNYTENGELVDLHEHYNDSKCYLSDDGLSGFAITETNDLISVFNCGTKRGFLKAISSIVKENAKTLDCYVSINQDLQAMYTKIFGFKTASIMDYNMEYDHDNIAENHNKPQVAFMVNTKENVETKHFNKDQYDEAQTYQQSFIKDTAKYSLKDSEGNTLTPEQQEFFKDSKVRDENGNLLVVYHSTNEEFTVFDKTKKGSNTQWLDTNLGFFFSPNKEITKQFGNITKSYYLNISNPLDLRRLENQVWDEKAEYSKEDTKLLQDLANAIGSTKKELIEALYDPDTNIEEIIALEEVKNNLEKLSYDGVVKYIDKRNNIPEYVAFEPNQIKAIDNKTPTENKDIRYSLKEQTPKTRTYKQAEFIAVKADTAQKKLAKTIKDTLGSKKKIWKSDTIESSLQEFRNEIANASTGLVLTSKMKNVINSIDEFYKAPTTIDVLKELYTSDEMIKKEVEYLTNITEKSFDATMELEDFEGKTTLDLVRDVVSFFNQTTREEIVNRKEQEKITRQEQANKSLNQFHTNAPIQKKMGKFNSSYVSGIIDNSAYLSYFNNDFIDTIVPELNKAQNNAILVNYYLTSELTDFLNKKENKKYGKKHLVSENSYRNLKLTNVEIIDLYLLAGTDGVYYNLTAEGVNPDREIKNKDREGKVSLISGQEVTDTYLADKVDIDTKDIIETFLEEEKLENIVDNLENVTTYSELYEELKNIRDNHPKIFDKYKVETTDGKKTLRDIFTDLKKKAVDNMRKDIYNNYLTEQDHQLIEILERMYNDKSRKIYSDASDNINGFHYELADNYYPKETDSNVLFKGIGNSKGEPTIYNPSFAKARQFNSKQRLVITNALNKALNYAKNLSLYAKMTPTIIKYNNILNERIKIEGSSEKQSIYEYVNKNIDAKFTHNVLTLFKGAQGIEVSKKGNDFFDRLFRKLRSWFSTYSIGINVKSILAPAVSMPLVRNYVSRASAYAGFSGRGKASFDKCLELSPQTKMRFAGENYAKLKTLGADIDRITEWALKPLEASEKVLYKYIWNVAQVEAKNTGYGEYNTETNLQKAVEIFETITFNTQAQWDVINNSRFQYAGGEMTKSLLVFTADTRKQLSLLVKTYNKLVFARNQYKQNPNEATKAEYKKSLKQFATAVTTNLETMVLMTLLIQAFKFLKGKHDEDEPEEILVDTAKDFFLGQVVGLFPGISDLVEKFVNGYDIEMGALSNINSAIDDINAVYEALTSGNMDANDIVKFINVLGRLTGIPTKNLIDNIYMPLRLFSPEIAVKMKNIFYGYSANSLSTLTKIYANKKQSDRLQAIIQVRINNNDLDVSDKVTKELARLYMNGETKVFPTTIGNSISVNGEVKELDKATKTKLTNAYKIVMEQLDMLMQQQYYLGLTDEQKAYAIRKLYDVYYENAKNKALGVDYATKLGKVGNYVDLNKIACTLAKTNDFKATNNTTRKAQVTKYINQQNMNKAEKYLTFMLSGYSLGEENQKLVSNYLIGKGMKKADVETLF